MSTDAKTPIAESQIRPHKVALARRRILDPRYPGVYRLMVAADRAELDVLTETLSPPGSAGASAQGAPAAPSKEESWLLKKAMQYVATAI